MAQIHKVQGKVLATISSEIGGNPGTENVSTYIVSCSAIIGSNNLKKTIDKFAQIY